MVDFAVARTKMVDGQIRPNSVTNHALLAAFLKVPRELFVPAAGAELAYLDRDVALSSNPVRSLLAPMVTARLLQAALVQPGESVLEIAAGTGYTAAILAELGAHVTALEEDPALAGAAKSALAKAGYPAVTVAQGPLAAGHAASAPYQAIIISGAIDDVPAAVAAQLAEGGRLVAVVGQGKSARATLFTKTSGALSARVIANLPAILLPGFARKPEFVF